MNSEQEAESEVSLFVVGWLVYELEAFEMRSALLPEETPVCGPELQTPPLVDL